MMNETTVQVYDPKKNEIQLLGHIKGDDRGGKNKVSDKNLKEDASIFLHQNCDQQKKKTMKYIVVK